jgi:hypothetical protein
MALLVATSNFSNLEAMVTRELFFATRFFLGRVLCVLSGAYHDPVIFQCSLMSAWSTGRMK